jgi:hypothetical protein
VTNTDDVWHKLIYLSRDLSPQDTTHIVVYIRKVTTEKGVGVEERKHHDPFSFAEKGIL